MQHLRVAFYARVSSGHQASDATIASQIAALDARLAQDGVRAGPEHRFVDDGHSGDTLLRPALERLRDAVATGQVETVKGMGELRWASYNQPYVSAAGE